MFTYEYNEYKWLIAGDEIINLQEVRRFSKVEVQSQDVYTLTVHYLDGSKDELKNDRARLAWKALETLSAPLKKK